MSWTVGIETGGTFTDLLMIADDGSVVVDKVLSTPHAPEQAVLNAFGLGLEHAAITPEAVVRLLHGSTLAANALIERSAPEPVLITTKGFRDLLLIQRQDKTHIYDLFYAKPRQLIDRDRIFEVTERLDPAGNVVASLDKQEVIQLADRIVTEMDASSIAVCLLHAYANPEHERQIAEWIEERHPEISVTLSSSVCPMHREYERMSTTLISAYLRPVVDRYLDEIDKSLRSAGCPVSPLIMQSSGGVLPVDVSRRNPGGMYLSGPAAAVKGAAFLAEQGGIRNLITLDVGGTSSDICLITDGKAAETGHGGVLGSAEGLPLNLVMTDIVTIGAGGGSIAWTDAGGMLHVGPKSAGADPGPACYGRGGEAFTLTDAMLILGLLADGEEMPGGLTLSRAAAEQAANPLAGQLNMQIPALAQAVYRIAIANMARTVRGVTVQRGFDPRDYALFACGGAGALMAAMLAEEMDIGHVIVPPHPGVFSAFGLTVSGLRIDFSTDAHGWSTDKLENRDVHARFSKLSDEAKAAFIGIDGDSAELHLHPQADARYRGQGYELRVALNDTDLNDIGSNHIAEGFHTTHTRRYGHAFPDLPVEVVNLRLTAESRHAVPWPLKPPAATTGKSGTRAVFLNHETEAFHVLERPALPADEAADGPALIHEATTTTLVPANWRVEIGDGGVLHLKRNVQPITDGGAA